MPRPTVAAIHLSAIRANFRQAGELARGADTMAVIKANGYGHGLVEVARALSETARCYAVACIEEAISVRQAGLRHPVVLLEGVHQAVDLQVCHHEHFEPVIHCEEQLQWLEATNVQLSLWLKVNSGMNRLGLRPDRIEDALARMRRQGHTIRGLMSHFACADDPQSPMTQQQSETLVALGRPHPELLLSACNSAAHFLPHQPSFDWTRPGIMLYGGSPLLGKRGCDLNLLPAMSLQSELISVRDIAAGESVGYGMTWTAEQPTRMGIVCIGYGDGYPRHAGTGTPAWVRDTTVRLIGRVSMDMLALDLSAVPEARVGDRVELWGEHISIDDVATSAGTISYELLTQISQRVPRVYYDH